MRDFAKFSVSAVLLVLLANLTDVVSAENLVVKDVLRALQSSTNYYSNDSSSSNATTSSYDARMNYANNNNTWSVEAAYGGTEDTISGPIIVWLQQLTSSGRHASSAASSFLTSNILTHFIRQVTNRTVLCELLNGTCVLPENCAVLGLTLGYDYGRGSSSDVGKYFTCDDASTICCYPFLLSSLSFLHNRYAGNYYGYNDSDDDDDDDDSGGHLEGFDTVYEYWYPNNRRQLARRLRRPPGRYGRRRPDNKYRDSRRSRYHRNNRPPFPRWK